MDNAEPAVGTAAADAAVVDVLVVDDQAPFRAAARTLVDRTAGFRVVGDAASAEDALDRLDALRPALVLMDVRLPGLNGVEATRAVLARRPGTVVVLCSTYEPADLPGDLETCGAAAYVRKEELTPAVLRQAWQGARPR